MKEMEELLVKHRGCLSSVMMKNKLCLRENEDKCKSRERKWYL